MRVSHVHVHQWKSVFHILDKDMKFNADCFLEGETTQDVWEVFMKIWVSP